MNGGERVNEDSRKAQHDKQPIKWRFEFSILGLVLHDFFISALAIIFHRLMGG